MTIENPISLYFPILLFLTIEMCRCGQNGEQTLPQTYIGNWMNQFGTKAAIVHTFVMRTMFL